MKDTRFSPQAPEAFRHAALRAWDETLRVTDGGLYWLRRDPVSGRSSLHMRDLCGTERVCLGDGCDVRSAVQGYGGGAYCVAAGRILFVNGDDGAVYIASAGQHPQRLTDIGPCTHGDLTYNAQRDRILCIRETLDARRLTQVVSISLAHGNVQHILASGSGFFAAPRVSPCGRYLAWIRWEFPAMPWDVSTLEVMEIGEDDAAPVNIYTVERVATSIIEPYWSSDSTLYFLDDRSGWWLPHAWRPQQAPQPVLAAELEFGFPPYKLGLSTYAVSVPQGDLHAVMVAAAWRAGKLIMIRTDLTSGESMEIALPFEEIRDLQFARGAFWFVGTTASAPAQIVHLDPRTWAWSPQRALLTDVDWRAHPARQFAFTARDGATVYAHLCLPPGEPPRDGHRLVVNVHGGPTGIATQAFNPVAQFWLDSGFAYMEVNHRGSTGFGRRFRETLNGHWGIVETHDCIDAVEHVCRHQPIDAEHVFIRGNSAGGFTALRALIASQRFRAAGCYYGVTDLSRLCAETHKFESQYTFSLLGPYPACSARYDERSPLRNPKRIAAPVIFFQGALDSIVDPQQTRHLADAMRDDDLPSSYIEFPDEGHGFHKAANFACALELERAFYNDQIVGKPGQ